MVKNNAFLLDLTIDQKKKKNQEKKQRTYSKIEAENINRYNFSGSNRENSIINNTKIILHFWCTNIIFAECSVASWLTNISTELFLREM